MNWSHGLHVQGKDTDDDSRHDTRRKTKGKAPKQVDGWTARNPIVNSSLQDLVTGYARVIGEGVERISECDPWARYHKVSNQY